MWKSSKEYCSYKGSTTAVLVLWLRFVQIFMDLVFDVLPRNLKINGQSTNHTRGTCFLEHSQQSDS